MQNFFKYNSNSIALVPGLNHGAISPIDWSPRGSGVKIDFVHRAIDLHEETGLSFNQEEIERFIDVETDMFSI